MEPSTRENVIMFEDYTGWSSNSYFTSKEGGITMASSPKLILGIVAAALVAGGLVAVRTLTSPADDGDGVEVVDEREDESRDSSGSGSRSSSTPSTRVSATDDDSPRVNRPAASSGRTFERGEGAAALGPHRSRL